MNVDLMWDGDKDRLKVIDSQAAVGHTDDAESWDIEGERLTQTGE